MCLLMTLGSIPAWREILSGSLITLHGWTFLKVSVVLSLLYLFAFNFSTQAWLSTFTFARTRNLLIFVLLQMWEEARASIYSPPPFLLCIAPTPFKLYRWKSKGNASLSLCWNHRIPNNTRAGLPWQRKQNGILKQVYMEAYLNGLSQVEHNSYEWVVWQLWSDFTSLTFCFNWCLHLIRCKANFLWQVLRMTCIPDVISCCERSSWLW